MENGPTKQSTVHIAFSNARLRSATVGTLCTNTLAGGAQQCVYASMKLARAAVTHRWRLRSFARPRTTHHRYRSQFQPFVCLAGVVEHYCFVRPSSILPSGWSYSYRWSFKNPKLCASPVESNPLLGGLLFLAASLPSGTVVFFALERVFQLCFSRLLLEMR